MEQTLIRLRWALAASLLFSGCGTRGSLYTQALEPLPLLTTRSALVSVVPQTSRAAIVRPDANRPTQAVPISEQARRAEVSPAGDRVIILGGTIKHPVIDLLDPEKATVETLDIHGLFDMVSFSPDGSLAILTYSARAPTAGVAARNLNEIDVVDLISRTVTRMQLDTDSLAPRSVVFAPAQTSPESQRVAVTFDKGVAVFDALQPQKEARRIAVRPPGSTAQTSVQRALFSPDACFLYLQASGLDDVVVVELAVDGEGVLAPAINFVAGGTGLSGIEVPRGAGQEHSVLAIYTGTREAVLLDALGIEENMVRLSLSDPLTKILALADGKVLVYDGDFRTVVAWDPASGKSGPAVLDAGFDSALVADGLGEAIFRHPSMGTAYGGGALSVVFVEEDVNRLRVRAHSIQLAANPQALLLDGSQGRLFLAVQVDGVAYLVRLDLSTLEPTQVILDAPAAALSYLAGTDTVATIHSQDVYGDVTFLPAAGLDRAQAVRVTDFALAGDADSPSEEK
jgi:hypothetical protein